MLTALRKISSKEPNQLDRGCWSNDPLWLQVTTRGQWRSSSPTIGNPPQPPTTDTLSPPHCLPGKQTGSPRSKKTDIFTFLIKIPFCFIVNNMETGKWLEVPSYSSCLKKMGQCVGIKRTVSKRKRCWSCKLIKPQLPHPQNEGVGTSPPWRFSQWSFQTE